MSNSSAALTRNYGRDWSDVAYDERVARVLLRLSVPFEHEHTGGGVMATVVYGADGYLYVVGSDDPAVLAYRPAAWHDGGDPVGVITYTSAARAALGLIIRKGY